jgi:ArsR family transcriptional regulator
VDTIGIILGALAEPTRRQALGLLWPGRELCVCELMSILDVTQSRMSRHMSVLKAAGLVLDRRDAQWVRYRRNPGVPGAIVSIVESVLSAMTEAPRRVPLRQTNKVQAEKVSV